MQCLSNVIFVKCNLLHKTTGTIVLVPDFVSTEMGLVYLCSCIALGDLLDIYNQRWVWSSWFVAFSDPYKVMGPLWQINRILVGSAA